MELFALHWADVDSNPMLLKYLTAHLTSIFASSNLPTPDTLWAMSFAVLLD